MLLENCGAYNSLLYYYCYCYYFIIIFYVLHYLNITDYVFYIALATLFIVVTCHIPQGCTKNLGFIIGQYNSEGKISAIQKLGNINFLTEIRKFLQQKFTDE